LAWSWWGKTLPFNKCGDTVASNGWTAYLSMVGNDAY
jgi:hypothetical protein